MFFSKSGGQKKTSVSQKTMIGCCIKKMTRKVNLKTSVEQKPVFSEVDGARMLINHGADLDSQVKSCRYLPQNHWKGLISRCLPSYDIKNDLNLDWI